MAAILSRGRWVECKTKFQKIRSVVYMPYKNKLLINFVNKNIFDKIMEPRHGHNLLQ